MSRQTRAAKSRLNVSTQTPPIMSTHENDDDVGVDGAGGGLTPQPPIIIPVGATTDQGAMMALLAHMTLMWDQQREEARVERERERADREKREETERIERERERESDRVDRERERVEFGRRLDEERFERHELAKTMARRDTTSNFKVMGKAPRFCMEKDRDNMETWKLKWRDFLISSSINSISGLDIKAQQEKAALTSALSDDTLKWVGGQGFDPEDLKSADFIINAIEKHIEGTTNPYVQVVDLIGRKMTESETFDHFMTDVTDRLKKCALDKVTDVTSWFGTMIVVANHRDLDTRKKLLLVKDLQLDQAKAICKEEEKAARTSKMLGISRMSTPNPSVYNTDASDENGSAAGMSAYKANRGRGQALGRGGYRGGGDHGSRQRGSWAHGGESQRNGSQRGEYGRSRSRGRQQQGAGFGQDRGRSPSNSRSAECWWCGFSFPHPNGICPAADKKCIRCEKVGHFAKMCKSTHPGTTSAMIADASTTAHLSCLQIGSAGLNEKLELVEVCIINRDGQSETISALPDTGANITAFQPDILPKLGMSVHNLAKETRVPKSADGSVLKTLGSIPIGIERNNLHVNVDAYVIEGLQQPILSRRVLLELGMIPKGFPNVVINSAEGPVDANIEELQAALKAVRVAKSEESRMEKKQCAIDLGHGQDLNKIANQFPQVFDNSKIPTMKGAPYCIELEDGVIPFNKGSSRTVPEPCMKKLEAELKLQLSMGLIERVTPGEKCDWLHPIVVAPKKDGAIRLCVDLRMLNKSVRRPENPQRSPWEVVRTIPAGCQHFAVFDAFKGYHQVELDPESRKLTTFHTPFGRYRYVRLAMGLSSAGDVFTTRYGDAVDYTIDGRRCTEDTLVYGFTSDELASKTQKFIKACSEANITLNIKKIVYDRPEVVFGGYLLNASGYGIDPALTVALSNFPVPTSQTDMRSFCGLSNQLSNFSDTMAETLSPFKHLLKKGTKFLWNDDLQAAFEDARKHLASPKVLAYYRPDRKTRLVTDASRLQGIGFVLKQEVEPDIWRPVQAGSRFLTITESRYAMVEIELLAICWAARKTAAFIDGLPLRLLEVWTDHAPLVPILNKYTLPEIENKRLQRLRSKLDHLQFKAVWIKGKDNIEADILSRLPCQKPEKEDIVDDDTNNVSTSVLSMVDLFEGAEALDYTTSPLRDEKLLEVRNHFDSEYNKLKSIVEEDAWPDRREECEEVLVPYWNHRAEFAIDNDGFVIKNERLVIPGALRQTYLKRLLAMHQQSEKMETRARKSMWWPFMSRDIKLTAKTCLPCQERLPSLAPEPERAHETAFYPFHSLHMDLCNYENLQFLIIVDQFSMFPHIFELGKTATTRQVVDRILLFISTYSSPVVIYSDGGPQFRDEFDVFCKEWDISHIKSSPHYPQSNGIAENAVKDMKKIISAVFDTSTRQLNPSSLASALLMFRNTARCPTDLSPAQLVFGRHLRDSLPFSRQMLRPQNRFEIEKRRLEMDLKRKNKNDSSSRRNLSLLYPGQPVRYQDVISKRWVRTGKIVSFGETDRDYWIEDDATGRRFRRNRRILKPIEIEAFKAPNQPVQVPVTNPTLNPDQDGRSYANIASQPAKPPTSSSGSPPSPRRPILVQEPRRGERARKRNVKFDQDYVTSLAVGSWKEASAKLFGKKRLAFQSTPTGSRTCGSQPSGRPRSWPMSRP